jgi:hypothetical protein
MRDGKWHGLTEWQARQYREGKICEICSSSYRLVVDHDHSTGGLRGVLCSHCNLLVGLLENTTKLAAAMAYIRKYSVQDPVLAGSIPSYVPPRLRKPVPPHGTVARYNHRSEPCRCDLCKEARAEWDRNKNGRTKRPEGWGSPQHGTYAMYQNERKQGLTPCDECKEANRRYHNDRNAARRVKAELKAMMKR